MFYLRYVTGKGDDEQNVIIDINEVAAVAMAIVEGLL